MLTWLLHYLSCDSSLLIAHFQKTNFIKWLPRSFVVVMPLKYLDTLISIFSNLFLFSSTINMSAFPELKQVIKQLNYPNHYYTYCIDNGIDTVACLSLICNYTNCLNKIPVDHWIMLNRHISVLKQTQSESSMYLIRL